MDAYTILLLGGTAVIWTAILSTVVAYAKHNVPAPSAPQAGRRSA